MREGRYWFWSIRPAYYPIPDDGPVGEMMHATERSIYRPGHIHLQVSAPGHVTLTTHVFVGGSPYIDQDAVFGKRDSLVVDFETHAPGKAVDGREMTHAVPLGAASTSGSRRCRPDGTSTSLFLAKDSHEDRQGHRAAHGHLHIGRTHHRHSRA